MKIKGLTENIKSFPEINNKSAIPFEKTNFQEVLNRTCKNLQEGARLSFLSSPSVISSSQVETNRAVMNSWEIKAVEHTLEHLEKYKDNLLNPQISVQELSREAYALYKKAAEIGQIYQQEGAAGGLRKLVDEIKMIAAGEIEIINRGDYG